MATSSKNKAGKPSKVVKPTVRKKRRTETTKNYRFQPFSQRIAKLKIDPISRRRAAEEQEEVSEGTETYIGKSLEEWRDLNLSRTYTMFAKEVSPYCDSLPMVLHNEDKIMDLLVTYIEKGDALAMEPLLNLLSHFAHDLLTRFERHFERAVATIAAVAAKHTDAAVIEWSFTCLAWLFKYLSRLLAPNLRPLYDLMSPYLGKEAQKPFIIRFAAESLSFLLRKTAAPYDREPAPLDDLVTHMLEGCSGVEDDRVRGMHCQGVMVLLTEAIKSVQGGLHSSGGAVVRSLLKAVAHSEGEARQVQVDVAIGTLTSIIHHTNAESFEPILAIVLSSIQEHMLLWSSKLGLAARLLHTMASVRKGTRIADWKGHVATLQNVLDSANGTTNIRIEDMNQILSAIAITMQSATIDVALSGIGMLECLRQGRWTAHFLKFCDLFARLGRERFVSFMLPELQKFIAQQWKGNDDELSQAIPRLAKFVQGGSLSAPVVYQEALVSILSELRDQSPPMGKLARANGALKALTHLKIKGPQQQKLCLTLSHLVESALGGGFTGDQADSLHAQNFALGTCLAYLLDSLEDVAHLNISWRSLCLASSKFSTLPAFWANMLRYMKLCKPQDLHGEHVTALEASAVGALALSSHAIRESSLEAIRELYELRGSSIPEVLSTAIAIETTPVSMSSMRAISMHARRLGSVYANTHDTLMQKAIPTYAFGLMHIQLAQIWDDAAHALSEMSATSIGEARIMELVQEWLEHHPESTEQASEPTEPLTVDTEGFRVVSDFECSNLTKIDAISRQVFEDSNSGYLSTEQQFAADSKPISSVAWNARAQALGILAKMPSVAEKRSRILVPVLLSWAGSATAEAESSDSVEHRWSRKDQKALLAIFARFNNPRVLYRSTEVYSALLKLCANGDVEIQQSSLRTILAWKTPAVNRYETHLLNLLDEARFRDELSVFLQEGPESETVQHADQAELMPVLLRLLYGRAVSGGKHEQGARRRAIFVALSRFGQDVLSIFIDIATATVFASGSEEMSQFVVTAPLRQQLGMLNMINELLETLGPELEPFAGNLSKAIMSCTIPASELIDITGESDGVKDASLLRAVRQIGLQCLIQLYVNLDQSRLTIELGSIVDKMIVPRLHSFATENTQAVSGILRLLSTWCTSASTATALIQSHEDILQRVADLLCEPNAKDPVRLFILRDVLDVLLDDTANRGLLQPFVPAFVRSIDLVLSQQPSKEVLDACVSSLTKLAGRIESPAQARSLLEVCTGLLAKPNKMITPHTKIGLLRTVLPLLSTFDVPKEAALYDAVCRLFSRLSDRAGRVLLADVLARLCSGDDDMTKAADICKDMNAQSSRLGEPDHERRTHGFTQVKELSDSLSLQQWLPMVHNCMFYIRDTDDLVTRSNAAQSLSRFAKAAGRDLDHFESLLADVLSGIERGMTETSELVRAEYLRVLDGMVNDLEWAPIADLKPLTVSGDDEASVFTNILHIQQHRRLRALRRLEAAQLKSKNVTNIMLPLLEHFVFDPAEGDAGRTLADQTIVAIGALASSSLTWSGLRTTFKRYLGYLSTKENLEKVTLRLIAGLVDAIHLPNETGEETVMREFLPPLMKYLHQKDESTVDRRMPVAVTVVKLLLLLPRPELTNRLPAILTDVSHVLRSRSQEARDQTRKTLATILSLIGTSYLGFMVKELRSALQRGYQLHVLSFTVHSLLVKVTEVCQPGDLDHCLPDLTSIIMDDIFGVTGQEKDAEEYKSGMKEVKSSKSFDTMELLARVTPINRLGHLIRPLRSLLAEKLDSKSIAKADELLTRLRKGIDQNPGADSRDLLVFCHEIVRQVYAEQNAPSVDQVKQEYKVRKYLIQMHSANKSKTKGATTSQMFKLTSFALNLVRKIVKRHEDLQTPSNMAGFLPMAGDALVQGQEEVKLAAMRLLATIIKVPLAELESNSVVYIKEAVNLIKAAPRMTTDSAKAALELVTAVLREKRSVAVRETDVAQVLKALKADIDEPDRQGVIYKFLRAVLGRKIVITEVYELMDEVGKVMVINPDRSIRESARSAYLQFVLDYPQGKDRWSKQTSFLVENLRYEHATGRQSIMELLHQLLTKIPEDAITQLGFTLFVALVPVQVTDADQACQQMAGILIGKLFERASDEQLDSYLALMGKWLSNADKPLIQIAALRCWSIYLKARESTKRIQTNLRDRTSDLLTSEDTTVGVNLLRAMLHTLLVMVDTAPEVMFQTQSNPIWQTTQQCLAATDGEAQEVASELVGALCTHLASSTSKTARGLAALPLRGPGGVEISRDSMRTLCRTSLRGLIAASFQISENFIDQTVRNIVFVGRCFAANEMIWLDGRSAEVKAEDQDPVEEDEDDGVDQPKQSSTALAYLLNRLSYIIRQDTFSTKARSAAVQAQAALINQLQKVPNLQSLLRPLYTLTDPSIARPAGDAHTALSEKAQELLDLIQKKVGPEAYIAAMGVTQKEARAKREDRRQKRKIEAVSAPERWAREKKKKHENQKLKNKIKGMEARGKRRGW